MFSKININRIIIDHFNTLRDFDKQGLRLSDFVLFLFFPVLLSAILVCFSLLVDRSFANILVTSFSIFAALLLNLLLLVFDIVRKTNNTIRNADNDGNPYDAENKRLDFLKEIYANISYAIFIAMLTIVILLITYFVCNLYLLQLVSFYVYFLSSNFILTLFMIIKRIHILLANELKEKKEEKEEVS